jgi:hypothetical protein
MFIVKENKGGVYRNNNVNEMVITKWEGGEETGYQLLINILLSFLYEVHFVRDG